MTVQEQIEKLTAIISNEINELVLVDSGRELLEQLLASYGAKKYLFSDKDVESLELFKKQVKAIEEFTEELGEFPYIEFKEEVDEVIGRLFFVVEQVNGLKVADRVNKEIRVLLEKKFNLPSRAVVHQSKRKRVRKVAIDEVDLANTLIALQFRGVNPPSCYKIFHGKMVLRESNGNFFWGCARFPDCWQKKQLTNYEINVINNNEPETWPGNEQDRIYVSESLLDIYNDIKSKHPDHLVIIQRGSFFEVFEQDAKFLSDMYGWKIYERQGGVLTTGFPEGAKEIWTNLRRLRQPYIIVSQLPNSKGGKVQRIISEIFSDSAS